MTRPWLHLKIACAFLVTSVLFYWKVILTHQFSFLTGGEGVNQAYSWYQFIFSSLRRGILPVWDPFVFSGRTFLGEMQTGAFYPANLLLALIPFNENHLFAPSAYHLYVAASHALAGYLMFRLARELGLGAFPGFVAGMTFSFGSMLQTAAGWPHMLQSGIWLPAIFECLLKAWREARLARSLALAGVGGLCFGMTVLAGGLHFAIMDAIVIVTAAVYMAAVEGATDWSKKRKIASVALVVLTVGAAFSAIQLLPSMEYSHLADRYFGGGSGLASDSIPYANLESDHLWPHSFLFFVFANGFNGNIGSGEALGFYLGVFPLLLAILGLWSARENRWCRYFAGLALAAFLYSMGVFSPLHGLAYALVPKIWLAREASRFMYLADFALAGLAAFGADALFAKSLNKGTDASVWTKPTRAVNWAAGAAGLALLVPGIFGHPDLSPWAAMTLLLILLSALLYRYIEAGHIGAAAKFLVVALVFFDLNVFDWSAVNKIDMARANQTDEMVRLLSLRGAAEFLKSRPGPFRVDPSFDRSPNIGDAFRIESTLGSGVSLVRDWSDIRARTDLMNVKYILRPASASEPDPIWHDTAWKIYENAPGYARAWLVHEVVVQPDRYKLLQVQNGHSLDLHRFALLTEPLTEAISPASDPAVERVVLDHYDAAMPDVTVVASTPGLLVLSENYYPGWRATVNGKPAKIIKVDGGLRGVVIPTGQSRVSMRYRPLSVIFGGILSLMTPIVVFLGWFFTRVRPIPKNP